MNYPTVILAGGLDWERILGMKEIPILEPTLTYCSLGASPLPCYLLAVPALTPEQKGRLVDALARIFGVSREEIANDILTRGVPIRAGVVRSVKIPSGWQKPIEDAPPEVFDLRMFT